jgi:putative endonuclease
MYYVYLLKSKKDSKYYVGYSSNLRSRYEEHQSGLVNSTKNRRPLELIYYESYNKEYLARKREENLKKFGSAYGGLIKRISS